MVSPVMFPVRDDPTTRQLDASVKVTKGNTAKLTYSTPDTLTPYDEEHGQQGMG